MKIGQI